MLDAPFYYLKAPERDIQRPVVTQNGKRGSVHLTSPGLWRIADKDVLWYGISITNCGACGILAVYEGSTRRLLWMQPSAFTGSFTMGAGVIGGLIIDNGYRKLVGTDITINWRYR